MSHALPRFHRHQEAQADLATIAAILIETGEEPPIITVTKATLPGDSRRLRGIPVVGGVTGTSPGTDPLQALLAKERRAA